MMCTLQPLPFVWTMFNFATLKIISYLLRICPDQNLDDCVYGKTPTWHFSQTIRMSENNWYSSLASPKYTMKAANPIGVSNMNISTATPYPAPGMIHIYPSPPTRLWIGNRSDEALFTKCCVHGILLVYSLVLQGEFLSIRLFVRIIIPIGLGMWLNNKVRRRGRCASHMVPIRGSHLSESLGTLLTSRGPTVTRGWSDLCSRSKLSTSLVFHVATSAIVAPTDSTPAMWYVVSGFS